MGRAKHRTSRKMQPKRTPRETSPAHGPTKGPPEPVRVRLLGGFSVSVGSQTIEKGVWRLRKAAGLVKLLALSSGHRSTASRCLMFCGRSWVVGRLPTTCVRPFTRRAGPLNPTGLLAPATWVLRTGHSRCARG